MFFFFNDTATTEIYTLSLHDALPISRRRQLDVACHIRAPEPGEREATAARHPRELAESLEEGMRPLDLDRKSTRLNSSHGYISYAVFCLKKKNTSKWMRPLDCNTGLI